MLKNKLRENVRKFKKQNKKNARLRLAAAAGRQVKGRFLCPLTQEVGTTTQAEGAETERGSAGTDGIKAVTRLPAQ